ncbi:MAG TPA: hypothetical protein VGH28_07785 [Polyangiaceae bacterium]|jgi:hypothetical protein
MKTRCLALVCLGLYGCSAGDAEPPSDGAAPDAAAPDAPLGSPDAGPVSEASADVVAQPDAGVASSTIAASPTFGATVNGTSKYPSFKYGTQRIWDSPPFQWGTLETGPCSDVATCSGGYDTGNLTMFDDYLANLKKNGVNEVWYTMARTPHFITSAPNDATCNYADPAKGGLGQCDRPSDLAANGTGTDLTFRKWYAFFAKRNNDAAYLATHAHIRYWEPWNEPDTAAFWGDGTGKRGSYDALIRLMQDTECLVVGAVGTGTITKTGETCAQVQASVGLTGPIDPTAIVVSPSYHAKEASLSLYQNFLYCNNAPTSSCTSGDAGAKSMMAFNLHMKPGAECNVDGAGTNCTAASALEPSYQAYIQAFEGILQKTELDAFHGGAVPLYDGEASYAPTGFAAPFTDGDMGASWIVRFFLYGRSLGVAANQWYTWDEISGNQKVVTAWNTLYGAWVGATPATPLCTNAGTVYTCSFTKGSASYEVMWDVAQSCENGVCTTSDQSVGGSWTTYRDLTGTAASCVSDCTISGGKIPVGIKPVLLAE